MSASQQQQSQLVDKLVETQLMKVAQTLEDHLDQEINRLDHLDEDGLEALRNQRLSEMRKAANKRSDWLAAGHGTYTELADERAFFDAGKQSDRVVCHFYRDSTFRCKIFDKHLALLAGKHLECRFVKLNAEKSPFITQRLGVNVIPTLVLIKEGQIVDKIIGFTDLGGHDEFSTEKLEWRLGVSEVIDYHGDLNAPPSASGKKSTSGADKFGRPSHKKTIRETNDSDSDDSDY